MLKWLTGLFPSERLGLARIGVGAASVLRAAVGLPILVALTDEQTMRAPYFSWLPRPATWFVILLVVVWIFSGLLFTLGWRVPVTGSLLLASVVTTLALDQQTYSNHLYLMAWLVFLLVLADGGAAGGVGGNGRPVVRWPVLLLMAQVSIVYGFSGLTKINQEFLSGAVLAGVMRGGLVQVPEVLLTPGLLSVLAGIVIVVELFLALMLWSPRFRHMAAVVGIGFHLAIALLMAQTLELLVFSMEMLAVYPVFTLVDTPDHQMAPG